MIRIYHIEARRSERVAWLLEELAVPYELVFKPGDVMGSGALMQGAHPTPMAPVVEDGGDVLIESGAILETLLNRYGGGRLRPAVTSPEHPRYLEWLHYAEGTAMARFTMEAVSVRLPPSKNPEVQKRRVGVSARILKYLDDTLARSPYLAGGEFTAADINMHFAIRIGASIAAGEFGVPSAMLQPSDAAYAPYPHLKAYMDRLEARPAFQRMRATTMPQGWPAI
jgi:glutathione S-transferase